MSTSTIPVVSGRTLHDSYMDGTAASMIRVKDAAKRLGVTRQTIRAYAHARIIDAVRIHGTIWVKEASVLSLERKNMDR